MTNAAKYAVALALILAATVAVAGGIKSGSPVDAAKPGSETPVRATKGDRFHVRPEIRVIAGVTVVLRDFDRTIY